MTNCWVKTPNGFVAAFPEDETPTGFQSAGNFGAPTSGGGSPAIASATTSTIAAAPVAVVADGSSTSSITVTLRDANTNVISGKSVVLRKSTGNAVVTPSSQTTNAAGTATFTVSDAFIETVTISAFDTTDNVTLTSTVQISYTSAVGSGPVALIPGNILSLQDQSFETAGSVGTWHIDTGAGGAGTVSQIPGVATATVKLNQVATIHFDGSTNTEAQNFANIKTQAAQSGLWANGPYNFSHYMNETGDSNTASGAASDIGNMADGFFVENGVVNANIRAYQFWPTRPQKIIVSCELSYGSGNQIFGLPPATARTNFQQVIGGSLDGGSGSGFIKLGQAIAASGLDMSNMYIRFGWESSGLAAANTPNYPWAYPGGNQDVYALAFQHAVNVVRAQGYTGKFEWNLDAGGGFDATAYPGDAFTDVIGVDVYAQGPWTGVNSTLTSVQTFARQRGKQFGISEWGYSASAGDDANWMTQFLGWLKTLPPPGQPGGLAYFTFFNTNTGNSLTLSQIPNAAAVLKAAIA